MGFGLFNTGEELIIENFFGNAATKPLDMDVGLYEDRQFYINDNFEYENIEENEDTSMGDVLTDSDDIGSINTEPAGAAYARQTVQVGTDFSIQKIGGNWGAVMADVTFDVSDSTSVVNGIFVVANFQSDDTGDQSANDHLFLTAPLQNRRPLDPEDGDLTFKRTTFTLS